MDSSHNNKSKPETQIKPSTISVPKTASSSAHKQLPSEHMGSATTMKLRLNNLLSLD